MDDICGASTDSPAMIYVMHPLGHGPISTAGLSEYARNQLPKQIIEQRDLRSARQARIHRLWGHSTNFQAGLPIRRKKRVI